MSNIQIFNYDTAEVRVIAKDGEPWFVAKDVCDILGLKNPTMALEVLEEDERAKYYLGRQGEANIISESGLYALIFQSRKPAAKKFRYWVTHDVLPTIRKTGKYSTQKAELESLNVRAAEVLQRIAQLTTSEVRKDFVLNEAFKLVTGQEMPKGETRKEKYYTSSDIAKSLKWLPEAVMTRAENLRITKKAKNGYWEGDIWYFSEEGRKKFMEFVEEKIVRIDEESYAYYEDGRKRIYWSFDIYGVEV